MACRKCASDWKTATGRDCQRCPHCDKVQRHIARKAGRWIEVSETVACKNCGKEFTNLGANVGKKTCCSGECSDVCRKAWRATYVADYKRGQRRGTQATRNLPKPTCKRCGLSFKRKHGGNNSNLYCSKKCFFEARTAGDHNWDRTSQRKAQWHRGGPYASAPSVRLLRLASAGHNAVIKASQALYALAAKELNRPSCQQCGTACKNGASRFCSYRCNKVWRGVRKCHCGASVHNASAFGRAPLCVDCKRTTMRAWRRIAKDTRKRVRRGGGHWNPEVKAHKVFERDKWVCYMCKVECEKVYDPMNPLSATMDHVYPVAHGGDHDWHNVRTACAACNSKKGAKRKGQLRLRLK